MHYLFVITSVGSKKEAMVITLFTNTVLNCFPNETHEISEIGKIHTYPNYIKCFSGDIFLAIQNTLFIRMQ